MRQLKITKSITNRESASLDKYLQEIGREELISVEEEVELAGRIKNGDKVLFVEESGRIYMMNSSMDAFREAQRAFAGEAERLGLKDDDDVMAMIKEFREESVVK